MASLFLTAPALQPESTVLPRLAFLELPPLGDLEKVLEAIGALPGLLTEIGAVRAASGTGWRLGFAGIHALFKEGEPTQDNCSANRRLRRLVSPEVSVEDEALPRARVTFARAFLAGTGIIVFFGREEAGD